ncbi:MAG: hypothetical protein ABIH78_01280 [Candidatus Peregrinibacteria bacterium]
MSLSKSPEENGRPDNFDSIVKGLRMLLSEYNYCDTSLIFRDFEAMAEGRSVDIDRERHYPGWTDDDFSALLVELRKEFGG